MSDPNFYQNDFWEDDPRDADPEDLKYLTPEELEQWKRESAELYEEERREEREHKAYLMSLGCDKPDQDCIGYPTCRDKCPISISLDELYESEWEIFKEINSDEMDENKTMGEDIDKKLPS